METRSALALLLVILFGALTWRVQRRHRDQVRARRRGLWDFCLELFDDPKVLQDDVGFPILRAVYGSRRVTLEAIADHIAVRKLPQLWLRATVSADLPTDVSLDFLARPDNLEFYSTIWSLPTRIPIPAAWP